MNRAASFLFAFLSAFSVPRSKHPRPSDARSPFVVAFVVLPALLGCDVEDDVLTIVLSGFGFGVLSEAADEDDFVDYVELGQESETR